jgi:hypothetical protein
MEEGVLGLISDTTPQLPGGTDETQGKQQGSGTRAEI